MRKALRILMAESSEADAASLLLELQRHGYEPSYERVETREALAAALDRQEWDIVIAAHNMPQLSPLSALEMLKQRGLDTPFIVSTGNIGQPAAVEAMKAGADDYVVKSDLARLVPAIDRELEGAATRRAHHRTEAGLGENEALKGGILEASLDAIIVMDHEGKVAEFNQAAERTFGYAQSEAIGRTLADLIIPSSLRSTHQQSLAHHLRSGKGPILGRRVETTAMRKDGQEFPVEMTVTRIPSKVPPVFAAHLRDITDRKQTEEKLALLASFPGQNPNPVLETDLEGNVTYVNRRATRLFPDLQSLGTKHPLLEDFAAAVAELRSGAREEVVREIKVGNNHYERAIFLAPNGWTVRIFAMDVTERRQLEEQSFQVQKLEAIGQLAGGIAHHFNNIMGGVKGFSELLLMRLAKDDPLHQFAERIKDGADRAASLTRQLLAYSRNVPRRALVLDLNAVVASQEQTVRSLVGDPVRVMITPGKDLWRVKADPVQIEQLIVNLTTNARDAITSHGRISIETANVTVNEEYARQHPDAVAGDHVLLAISDTGAGMTDAVKSHLFEPFFTTKDLNHGTGLGLATCYGIARQSGGHIAVSSEEGKGTTVRVYFPRCEETD